MGKATQPEVNLGKVLCCISEMKEKKKRGKVTLFFDGSGVIREVEVTEKI
jgi:hypothetical protein